MIAPMLGDRKKLVNDIVVMIGRKGPKRNDQGDYEEVTNSNSEMTDDSSEMKMFAQDIIKAVENKNVERLATILTAFKACCQDGEEMSESEPEEKEEM